MARLNSGIFKVFELSEKNLNLKSEIVELFHKLFFALGVINFTMHDGKYTDKGQLPSDMSSVVREIGFKYPVAIQHFGKFF